MQNQLKLFNTKTSKKEPFVPLQSGKVSMYVCGPTVYDYCHVGHARAYTVFDTLFRYLLALQYQVTYVRNLTDIDDKIIQRAQKENVDFQVISQRFTTIFQEDMQRLGLLSPTHEPRATQHIPGMIQMIEALIAKQHAYVAHGDVYFNTDSYADYLSLSGRQRDDLLAGARVEVNQQKTNPLDFVLWKAAKPGEPAWPSPWGDGRPGWHIECSVMSRAWLGVTIDIHGGGRDLIFPHHENEQAQSETAHAAPFVRYWLHNGFVNLDKEKMSKSLGNLVTIRNLLEQFHPEVIRHALLSAHYRSPIEFSMDLLHDSKAALQRLYLFLQNAGTDSTTKSDFGDAFYQAMNDDLNTPKALAALFDLAKEGNRLLQAGNRQLAAEYATSLKRLAAYLGLLQSPPDNFLQGEATGKDDAAWVEALIQQRLQARAQKDFKTADKIRHELAAQSIIIEDHPNGTTTWRRSK